MKQPKTILLPCDYYLPGWKAGGCIRTINNFVEQLGDEFRFLVIAGDRDFGDESPYSSITANQWHPVGKAQVMYISPRTSLGQWGRLLTETPHDLLYLNSFFSPAFTIKPLIARRLGWAPSTRCILAPQGELSAGALGLKRLKKGVYLSVAKALGIYQGIGFKASSELEREEIRSIASDRLGIRAADIWIATDCGRCDEVRTTTPKPPKAPGSLRVVFLSRICEKKNLLGALKMLTAIRGEVFFGIHGPIQDAAYWEECQRAISGLPSNIKVAYLGPLPPEKAVETFETYDLFLFPTLGENFGHVILESLLAGCPVLISDRTPWRVSDEGAGWALPVERTSEFATLIQDCVNMGAPAHRELSDRARMLGLRFRDRENARSQQAHREMFSNGVQSPGTGG